MAPLNAVIDPTQATSPTRRRTGRPRKAVRLVSPGLCGFTTTEHRDAVTALSALLECELDGSAGVPASAVAAASSAEATRRVLAQLSPSSAKMPSRSASPSTQETSAA